MRSALRTVASRCAMTSTVRPLHELAQRLLDHELALGVEVGGGLVEDQDGRILEERARDGEALALAAAEPHAALAHQRPVALGQAGDELLRVRLARRAVDRPPGGAPGRP